MIFTDLLSKYGKELHSEFESILNLCFENQFHKGDLLLWKENGFIQEELLNFKTSDGKKFSPHVIGPGISGHSEFTHYDFINQYRHSNISNISYPGYLEKVKYSPEKKDEIDKLLSFENTSIQIEMLIYLKIWEADLMIKKLYELTRIINGETYDWYFSVAESSRDKSATGTRQDIIRKLIRDKIAPKTQFFSDWITSIYKTQIRNTIAHSNYSISGRTISLNNFIKEDPASQLHSLTFDEWHEIFHKLLLMHNEYLWLGNTINSIYADKFKKGEKIEILITEKNGKQYTHELDYRLEFNDWHYKINNNR
jgi:hypothetical protein